MVEIDFIDGVLGRKEDHSNAYLCDANKFESICFNLKSQLGYIWLKDIIIIDLDEKFEVRYLFYFLENNYKFTFTFEIDKDETVKSIAHIWLNAVYMEQEIYEMFGINFSRRYRNLIFANDNSIFPMRKNCSDTPKVRKINFKSYVPVNTDIARKELIRLKIDWDGNLVKKSTLCSGLFHCGLEKIVEGQTQVEIINTLETYFLHRGPIWSMAFAKSVEVQNYMRIPDRAMALRMIIQEFIRVLDHLYFLRDIHLELKHPDGHRKFISYIKIVNSLMISFSGNENMVGVCKIGGMHLDVDQVWMSRAMDELTELSKSLTFDFHSESAASYTQKTLNFPLLDKTLAYNKCLSGPVARSVGLNLDLRKKDPEYFYNDVDFEVPIGPNGSAFDLYCVRFQEIFQSIKIIIQVLDNLPTGDITSQGSSDLRVLKRSKGSINDKEYLQSFKTLITTPNTDMSYFYEGPNGHIGLTTRLIDSKLDRLKLFSNEFILKNVFGQLSTGKTLDELSLSWRMLGIDMKAVER